MTLGRISEEWKLGFYDTTYFNPTCRLVIAWIMPGWERMALNETSWYILEITHQLESSIPMQIVSRHQEP